MKLEAAAAQQVPSMEAGIPCMDECLSFRTCKGDDTLDAFGSLAKYAQRPQTGNQPVQQAIASSITTPAGGTPYYRTNEPGPQGLMKVKTMDPVSRAVQMAEQMRNSRRKQL